MDFSANNAAGTANKPVKAGRNGSLSPELKEIRPSAPERRMQAEAESAPETGFSDETIRSKAAVRARGVNGCREL